jgi:hypothetical protein
LEASEPLHPVLLTYPSPLTLKVRGLIALVTIWLTIGLCIISAPSTSLTTFPLTGAWMQSVKEYVHKKTNSWIPSSSNSELNSDLSTDLSSKDPKFPRKTATGSLLDSNHVHTLNATNDIEQCKKYKHIHILTQESEQFYKSRGGISKYDFELTANDCNLRFHECLRVQIVNSTIFVVEPIPKAWESRGLATLLLLEKAIQRIQSWSQSTNHALEQQDNALLHVVPNADIMIHVGDYHHTNYHYWSFSRPVGLAHGWVLPEYSFFGWPEVGLRTWPEMVRELNWIGKMTPWLHKKPQAIWRGNNFVPIRNALLKSVPSLFPKKAFDIKETTFHGDHFMTMKDQCQQYQYHIYTEGWAHSGRLKYQLFCGGVVIAHQIRFREFFTPLLENNKHWIELPDRDWTRLSSVLSNLLEQDEIETNSPPQRIAKEANRFANEIFHPDVITCYIHRMLKSYSSLTTWNPFPNGQIHENAVPLQHLLRRVLKKMA